MKTIRIIEIIPERVIGMPPDTERHHPNFPAEVAEKIPVPRLVEVVLADAQPEINERAVLPGGSRS